MTITAKTQVLAVCGDPVAHSLSPVMHNGWIADHGLDAVYVALRITGDAERAFRAMGSMGLRGVNVTVPHKEAAARAADHSGLAAANVLSFASDGGIAASNTDGAGFIDALNEGAPDWRTRVRTALVLGAGGAAQAIAAALSEQDVSEIIVLNRTRARGEAVAKAVARAAARDWSLIEPAFAEADLIVNATTLGMAGAADAAWPMHAAKANAIVMDIVYKPLVTPLLRAARARHLVAIDGLGMLIHQGARAFEIWFGVKPDVSRARQRLLGALA
ncbi:MAG: shikimate dehydrogenase [Alphaproteobacteria bacterium]|nr:shikimate dehydrogenase [Alphaproteobacteria bacterium]